MKRLFRPIFLAALCWILVALVPATRNELLRAGNEPFLDDSEIPTPVDNVAGQGDFEREAKRRFPNDRRVEMDALTRPGANAKVRERQAIAAGLQNDPTVIAILLRAQFSWLKSDRIEGVLSNPGGPGAPVKKLPGGTSPSADWHKFIALARRGQKLEPNNSFFDWMMLYGLYATRRDAEARLALKLAARKTDYDSHSRQIMLNRLAVMRLIYGEPLSPRENGTVWLAYSTPEMSKMRQVARWVMEGAIADREANRHTRALDAAFDLAKMGRVMRRESRWLIESLVAVAIEGLTISRIVAPLPLAARTVPQPRAPRFGAPLSSYQASPISLYAYAKSQKRNDITRFLDREWPEVTQWRGLNKVNYEWTGNTTAQTVALTAAERLRALILRALPSILILGAFFTLLWRRFPDDSGAPMGGFWRGALAGVVLFPLALLFDATIILQNPSEFDPGWPSSYLDDRGLLATIPSWVSYGLALAVIWLAIPAAIGWQKRQNEPKISLKTRLQTIFDAPEDGLMRFDFGWVFGLIAKSTGWILLLLAFGSLCFNHSWFLRTSGLDVSTLGNLLMAAALFVSLALHYASWRTKPRRRATLRLGSRLVSNALLGFFVASSVLYALVAFAFLPLSLQYERNFQSAMRRGEVQIARAKLGF